MGTVHNLAVVDEPEFGDFDDPPSVETQESCDICEVGVSFTIWNANGIRLLYCQNCGGVQEYIIAREDELE